MTRLEARTARLKAEKKAAKKESKIKQEPVDTDLSKKTNEAGTTKQEQNQGLKIEIEAGLHKDTVDPTKSKVHGKSKL